MSADKTASLIRVIAGLKKLTRSRDRTLTQYSLVNTVIEIIHCQCCRLYSVKQSNGSIELQIAAMGQRKNLRKPILTSSKLHELVTQTIETREISITGPTGELLVVIPILQHDETEVDVLVIDCEEFTEEHIELTQGLLDIYCNFLSLVQAHAQDKLTGLLNRATLEETLEGIIARQAIIKERRAEPVQYWVAVIDIDHFKKLNDNYGHLFGDEILLLVAQQIKNSFREDDKCYRYGGEEFLVILKVDSKERALSACERLRQAIEGRVFPQDIKVTVSIGLVQINNQKNTSSIIGQADQALYFSKESGRNRLSDFGDLIAAGVFKQDNAVSGSIDLF